MKVASEIPKDAVDCGTIGDTVQYGDSVHRSRQPLYMVTSDEASAQLSALLLLGATAI